MKYYAKQPLQFAIESKKGKMMVLKYCRCFLVGVFALITVTKTFGNDEGVGVDYFCYSKPMSVNKVKLFDKTAVIKRHFGEPLKMKKWYRESRGNEGNYYVHDFIYQGISFSVGMGKDKSIRDRLQVIRIQSPVFKLSDAIYVGMSFDEVAIALKSLTRNYPKTLTLNKKSVLEIYSCDSEGTVGVYLTFDKDKKLKKIRVEYDSDFI